MIRPRCLAAFTRDAAHALGILTVVAAVADVATEAKHLRAENAYLKAQQARLVGYIDTLASANTELNRELDDAADAIADAFIKERVEENARAWLHDVGISEGWLDMEVAE